MIDDNMDAVKKSLKVRSTKKVLVKKPTKVRNPKAYKPRRQRSTKFYYSKDGKVKDSKNKSIPVKKAWKDSVSTKGIQDNEKRHTGRKATA